jgi:glycosyltransferase involved in cell wall biosynthesis
MLDTLSKGQDNRMPTNPGNRSHYFRDAINDQFRRAALFLPSLDGGGAERIFLNLAQGLIEYGVAVDILLTKREGVFLSSIPIGARLIDFSNSKPLRSVPALVRYLRARRPSVLLSTMTNANLAVLMAYRLAAVSTRLIVREASTLSAELRNSSVLNRFITKKMVRWLYPFADYIVAPSNGVADDLAGVTGLHRESIRVIYNPIISERLLSKARDTPDHPWLLTKHIPVVLGVGRLTAQKDFSTLIRAFAIVRRNISAKLIILGQGRERPLLQRLIDHEGLGTDIALIGFVANPYSFLAHSKVFVLSSAWEGLPGVLIEALACNAAVVSTDCPNGPREILSNGKYGQLVPVGDAEAMANAILKVLTGECSNPDLAEHLSLFDVQRNTHAYLKLLFDPPFHRIGPC